MFFLSLPVYIGVLCFVQGTHQRSNSGDGRNNSGFVYGPSISVLNATKRNACWSCPDTSVTCTEICYQLRRNCSDTLDYNYLMRQLQESCILDRCLPMSNGWSPGIYCRRLDARGISISEDVLFGSGIAFAFGCGCICAMCCRLLGYRFSSMVIAAIVSMALVFIIGYSPFTTRRPLMSTSFNLASVSWLEAFPLFYVGAAGTYIGVAVACVGLCVSGRSALTRVSSLYFSLAALCNTCGLMMALLFPCGGSTWFGPIWMSIVYWVVWTGGSFLTNVLLQKIVLLRVGAVNPSRVPTAVHIVFWMELLLSFALFCSALGVALKIVLDLVEMSTWEIQRSSSTASEGGNAFSFFSGPVILLISLISLFTFIDWLFTIMAVMMLQRDKNNAMQYCQRQIAISDSQEIAIRIAKFNLWLVAASTITTTVFNIASIVLVATFLGPAEAFSQAVHFNAEQGEITVDDAALNDYFEYGDVLSTLEQRLQSWLICWFIDTIFNDACIIFVGFGPVLHALQTVGETAAGKAGGVDHERLKEKLGAIIKADEWAKWTQQFSKETVCKFLNVRPYQHRSGYDHYRLGITFEGFVRVLERMGFLAKRSHVGYSPLDFRDSDWAYTKKYTRPSKESWLNDVFGAISVDGINGRRNVVGYDLCYFIRQWLKMNNMPEYSLCEVVLTHWFFKDLKKFVGVAQLFWSHLQAEPLVSETTRVSGDTTTLSAISSYLRRYGAGHNLYIWIDYACLRQASNNAFDLHAIIEGIHKIGALVACVDKRLEYCELLGFGSVAQGAAMLS